MAKPGRVLIFGVTGYIGKHIARASLDAGHPTFLFVRPDIAFNVHKAQLLMSLKRSGATFLKGTVDDHSSLVDAVKQVDIVISALGDHMILDQLHLIEAMKEAGNIKRFLPSEYGMDPDHLADCPSPGGDVFAEKRQVRRAVEKAGIPYTYVSANCLAGYFLAGLAQYGQFLPPTESVAIYGDGNQKVIWVREEDVAAYVIKTVADPRVVNTTVYIRPPANVLSQNEVVAIWEELSGKTLHKTHIPESTWLKDIAGSTSLYRKIVMEHFHLIFYLGRICDFHIRPNAEASQLYPQVNYTTAKSYLHDFV